LELAPNTRHAFPAEPDEFWWGGCTQDGLFQPYGFRRLEFDQRVSNNSNQSSPLLLSSHGRYLWSETPLHYRFDTEGFWVESESALYQGEVKGGLRGAYLDASKRFFPPSGKTPPKEFFTLAQFNTWIELTYNQNQEGILEYAKGIIDNGFAPGILMIDDGWQRNYGEWEFRSDRFPDPKAMTDELNELGFRVMVWVVPFVTPDTLLYRQLRDKGMLIQEKSGDPAIRSWWNGYGALLDMTNPETVAWLRGRLDSLIERYGVDGFKFDAGDFPFYKEEDVAYGSASPAEQCMAWAKLGLEYPFNEYRACWRMGGQPLVQRLWDKAHSWHENGLAALIPNSIAQGLLGYPFICPDMIGGGEYRNFAANSDRLDQELVVRMAQCSALMPMMQFSVAPWRILDEQNLELCREAAELHKEHAPLFWKLAKESAKTGEPILRALAYEYPKEGYERIVDQFMIGSDLMVAPVLEKAARSRRVVLPPGVWTDDLGESHHGPAVLETPVAMDRLPRYRRERGGQ